MQLSALENVRNMYIEYAHRRADEIVQLRGDLFGEVVAIPESSDTEWMPFPETVSGCSGSQISGSYVPASGSLAYSTTAYISGYHAWAYWFNPETPMVPGPLRGIRSELDRQQWPTLAHLSQHAVIRTFDWSAVHGEIKKKMKSADFSGHF